MIPLMALSAFGLVIFLERLFHLHRAYIHTQDFVAGILNVVRKGNLAEAVTLCEDTAGPVARIMREALIRMEDPPSLIAEAIHKAGLEEVPRLEHRLSLLVTMAKIAPMLGLFGTVVGLVEMLEALNRAAPVAHAGDLAAGMMHALVATATGLGIGILGFAGYNFLVSRVESLCVEMERSSIEIFTYLARRQNLRTQAPVAS
jgi:biopolymer transport protein ExbB